MSRVDRALSVVFGLAVLLEVALRPELPSRPFAAFFGLAIALAIAFRRNHPLAATVFAFGLATLTTAVEAWLHLPKVDVFTSACILLLPYSLCRWGTRRDVIIGSAVMLATWLSAVANGEMRKPGDLIGSAVVMILPGAIGAIVRFRDEAQGRALEQARLMERGQLARELHDSVAHHMAAITLQAQAARAVIATRPDDAKTALAAIEDESKRTLAELRAIVGTLRDDQGAPVSPTGGIADLPSLATSTTRPAVEVELAGDLAGLSPALERAVFRLAQESLTNALKHARNATRVRLRVAGEDRGIHLTAHDDGEPVTGQRRAGFGLVGMAERAALLGGTFEAGPRSGGGWQVDAVLPREGKGR
jgi:signal transduction histidine kinase